MACEFEFVDEGRAVTQVALSPCGALLLACDASGRVLLVDTADLAIVRMWKGYRGAACGWTAPLPIDPSGGVSGGVSHPLIWAPHRGVVEVWQRRHGGRLLALAVPGGASAARLVPVSTSGTGADDWGAPSLVAIACHPLPPALTATLFLEPGVAGGGDGGGELPPPRPPLRMALTPTPSGFAWHATGTATAPLSAGAAARGAAALILDLTPLLLLQRAASAAAAAVGH